jgi:S1-C subfamily serine protease
MSERSRWTVAVFLLATHAFVAAAEGTKKPWLEIGMVLRTQPGGERFLFVAHAPEELPAYRAGVRRGDLITAINGKRVSFRDDLDVLEFTTGLRVGSTVTFHIVREGKERDLRVRVGELPREYEQRVADSLKRVRAARSRSKS